MHGVAYLLLCIPLLAGGPAAVHGQVLDSLLSGAGVGADTLLSDDDTVRIRPAVPKTTMRFALLLPLFLEENLRIDTSGTEEVIDGRSVNALHFYEGALAAREELAGEGLTLDLQVLDISDDPGARHALLLNYQELKHCDLVVASFPPDECQSAVREADRIGLRMALVKYGTSEQAGGHPGLILMASPPFVQCHKMAGFLAAEDSARNYAVLSREAHRENELADIFISVLDSATGDSAVQVVNDFDTWITGIPTDEEERPAGLPRHLVLPSSDESYVSSVLSRLDRLGLAFEVTGLPTWEHFETLRFGKFANLQVRIFSSTWFDRDLYLPGFRKRFISMYKTDPMPSAYQAYEFITRTARLIGRDMLSFPDSLPSTFSGSGLFRFRKLDGGGHMNERIQIMSYDAFELRPVDARFN